jgi:chaperonin GroES
MPQVAISFAIERLRCLLSSIRLISPRKRSEKGDLIAPEVKAGDRILFGKYSGSEVKLEGEEHLILREDDILGILEG